MPNNKNAMQPKLLITVNDFMESNMIVAFLEQSGIPVFVRDLGSGGLLKVAMGYSIFGQELYVDKDQYQEASQLLKAFFDRQSEDGDDGIRKHNFGCF